MRARRAILAVCGATLALAAAACGGGAHHALSAPPTPLSPAGQPAKSGGGAPAYGDDFEAPAPAAEARASRPDHARDVAPVEPMTQPAPTHRPGLGTEWGETRLSRVTTSPFSRAEPSQPFALAKLFYNDAAGIAAMSDTTPTTRLPTAMFRVERGLVEVGLRDGEGRFLTGFDAAGRSYVQGAEGDRYTIVIKNRSPGRIEAVVSVDGLDVVDGRPAAFDRRGYLIGAHDTLEIDGFRRSEQAVAAFRFGSVSGSYAGQKHGDTRNVGVIGLAFFHERGDSPRFWSPMPSHEEVVRRHDADPFPAQFATRRAIARGRARA